ncbi:MAG: response regulator [bacterium]|nr:response regulator [bacterium]
MDILVVDSDVAIKEYYTHLLESEFRNVKVRFCASGEEALADLDEHSCDIVLTESLVSDAMDIFEFLARLTERRVPAVVVSSQGPERLIVECLRNGALDFVTKSNIKLGHLPAIIARALLEADRWQKIQTYERSVPHREEYSRLDDRLRSYVDAERRQESRAAAVSGEAGQAAGEDEFVEGQSYFIIYLYLQINFPPELKGGMDPRRFAMLQSRVLDKFVEIAPRYGGRLWTRKEDGCFFAFVGDSYLTALLAAIEIRASLNIFNMTVENLNASINVNMALTCGHTVYKEDHGQIYSEALNLSAHMAINNSDKNVTLLTASIYDQLDQRARKYLFKAGQFEGHEIYRYEAIA